MLPGCAPLMERLQLVLDGALPASALDGDVHAATCTDCRERITAARLLLGVLAESPPPSIPSGLTDSILAAVREDRNARTRSRSYAVAGGAAIAIAASLLLATWIWNRNEKHDPPTGLRSGAVLVQKPSDPSVAPEPRPIRLGDEFSKVGQALLDAPNPFAGPGTGGPGVFERLTISLPAARPAGFEPARDALAELPDAARSGLEPVTSTTRKAFARLLRDVGGMQVSARPKS